VNKSSRRSIRIGDQIQKELAGLIRTEIKDPRVGLVTITAVVVAADYSHARVFVTTLDEPKQVQETLAGLNSAAGFLRTALFHRLALRAVPALTFVYDESIERGISITSLIDAAVAAEHHEK
jgi:ribosome-binding factor A